MCLPSRLTALNRSSQHQHHQRFNPALGADGAAVAFSRYNTINDLAPLFGLTELNELYLLNNTISDVTPLF